MMEDKYIDAFTPTDWVTSDEIIKVLGVGGGGCNAVNYMYKQGISGCSFVVCNTDSQALDKCDVPVKIQLGEEGLGAGTNPTEGRKAALDRAYADNLWSPDGTISQAAVDTCMKVVTVSGLWEGEWKYEDMVDMRFLEIEKAE